MGVWWDGVELGCVCEMLVGGVGGAQGHDFWTGKFFVKIFLKKSGNDPKHLKTIFVEQFFSAILVGEKNLVKILEGL